MDSSPLSASLLSRRLRADLDRTTSDSDMSLRSGPQSPAVDVGGDVVLDVECGLNKAVLYLNRLSSGSKGPCVLFDNAWLTPNEFQYVSGRETAKDWKRSIKHYGKSLKLLIAKGFMTTDPASCKCEGCVVTDDKSDHGDVRNQPEANQENVPPVNQIRNEGRIEAPEVDRADKAKNRPEADDGHVSGNAGSEDKISVEICERAVLQTLADELSEVAGRNGKKRKSLERSVEKAKRPHKHSHDARGSPAAVEEAEVAADDINGDGDQSCVSTSGSESGEGGETPDASDNSSPEEAELAGDDAEVDHMTLVDHSPGCTPSPASPGRHLARLNPETTVLDDANNDRWRLEESVDDIKATEVDGCYPMTSDTEVKGRGHFLNYNGGADDNRAGHVEPIRNKSPAVASPSARHAYGMSEVTSLEANGDASGSPRPRADHEDERDGLAAEAPPMSDRSAGGAQDLYDDAPEAENRPMSAPQPDSSELMVNTSTIEGELGEAVPLSPRKEARLTCIIAELKSYKKQLIQRIEEQKVTGDLTDNEEGQAHVSGSDPGDHASGDGVPSKSADEGLLKSGEKASSKELQSSDGCKTLYNILSAGGVQDETKLISPKTSNNNNNSNNNNKSSGANNEASSTTNSHHVTHSGSAVSSSATSCSSVSSSCAPAAVHSTPETQPLKSSVQKEAPRQHENRKSKSKPVSPHADGRDQRKDAPKSSSDKKSASATRMIHVPDSISATLSTPVTPIPNSMYLAPPLFPFPYGIPPGYLYPSSLYGGFPFPDPTAIYKSLAASQALPIATSANVSYDFSIPLQNPFKSPTLSGKHSPVSASGKKDSKPSSKSSKRDKPSKSKSPAPSIGSGIQLFQPDTTTGHYMTMYPQFGFPDLTYLSSPTKAAQLNGHMAKLGKIQNSATSADSAGIKGRSSTRDRTSKSSHPEGGDILDLSVRKRSAGVPTLDHYAAAKIPCYGAPFPHRNGLVLDLSKSSAR